MNGENNVNTGMHKEYHAYLDEFTESLRENQNQHPVPHPIIQPGLEWLTAKSIRQLALDTVGDHGEDLMGNFYIALRNTYGNIAMDRLEKTPYRGFGNILYFLIHSIIDRFNKRARI